MTTHIFSFSGDRHSHCVAWALGEQGAECHIWDVYAYPEQLQLSLSLAACNSPKPHVVDIDQSIEIGSQDTVWLRRLPDVTIDTKLHKSDRKAALTQCQAHRDSWLAGLPSALVVNPRLAADTIRHKTPQLQLAQRIGFNIPRTLFSGIPEHVQDFVAAAPGQVIFKPHKIAVWEGENSHAITYTACLTSEHLSQLGTLKFSPGIFQDYVDKAFEVRVVWMGASYVAFRLDSQARTASRIDWRVDQEQLHMERLQLPSSVTQLCQAFMKAAGLVFGSFDFIVTPDGDYVFLEVNEQGQFLGYETEEIPLLQPFTEFLLSGNPDFVWDEAERKVRTQDYMNSEARVAEDALIAAGARIPDHASIHKEN